MSEDSVKKRFLTKLVVSVFSAGLNFCLLLFLPKILGPKSYGQYDFAINNFTYLMGALTLSVPNAYFNWTARKHKAENIFEATSLTFLFSTTVFLLLAFFLLTSPQMGFFNKLWPDLSLSIALCGLLVAFCLHMFQNFSLFADALGQTAKFEKYRLMQNFLKVTSIAIAVYFGIRSVSNLLFLYSIVIVVSIIAAVLNLRRLGVLKVRKLIIRSIRSEKNKIFVKFVIDYIKPLVVYTGFGFAFSFFDIWFLQLIEGSVEQSFLGISMKLIAVTGLVNVAMEPILTREFSVAYEFSHTERIKSLFHQIRFFFFISVTVGCIVFFNAETILGIIGGEDYKAAILPFRILAFYPALQTLARLNGSLYYASQRTSLYSKIGILIMPLGIILSYFLLAPQTLWIPGLGLGAKGVAIKMVLIDLLSVLALVYFNVRYLYLGVRKHLAGNLLIFLVQVFSFYFIKKCISFVVRENIFASLILEISLFSALMGIFVWRNPKVIGFKKETFLPYLESFRKFF